MEVVNLKEVRLDVRSVEPKYRLDTILTAWNNLPIEHALFLTVDHDPQCMYYTISAEYGKDTFAFDYIKSGPIDWEVKVTKHK